MKTRNIVLYILLLLFISDMVFYTSIVGSGGGASTYISMFCKYVVMGICIYVSRKTKLITSIPKSIVVTYIALLFWNVATIVHGLFTAENYWEWKLLFISSGLFLLVPLVFFIGKNLSLSNYSFSIFFKYGLTFGFFLLPLAQLTNEELYARIMIPISIFVIFIPYIKTKYKLLVIIVAVVSLISILDFRSNIVRILISFLILGTYYFRAFFPNFLFKVFHALIFLAPIIFLFLAVFANYNIFTKLSENQGYEVKTNANDASNLTGDTRTFLYVEVFNAMTSDGRWLFGQGAVGKYKSVYFTDLVTGNMRYNTEVGFLNTLLYSGLIGVVLYFLILFISSYYAIYRSKNLLCKMLGLLIASRWLLFFLEEFTQFDLNFYFLWLIIGLISTNQFRNLKSEELKVFFTFKRQMQPSVN